MATPMRGISSARQFALINFCGQEILRWLSISFRQAAKAKQGDVGKID